MTAAAVYDIDLDPDLDRDRQILRAPLEIDLTGEPRRLDDPDIAARCIDIVDARLHTMLRRALPDATHHTDQDDTDA